MTFGLRDFLNLWNNLFEIVLNVKMTPTFERPSVKGNKISYPKAKCSISRFDHYSCNWIIFSKILIRCRIVVDIKKPLSDSPWSLEFSPPISLCFDAQTVFMRNISRMKLYFYIIFIDKRNDAISRLWKFRFGKFEKRRYIIFFCDRFQES